MPTTAYLAYGLRLDTGFPLPGMTPRESDGLPSLSLRLCDAEELEQLWSGAAGPPTWRGRLGDGVEIAIHHGAGDDVLFTYGERARFLLDPTATKLACAPAHAGAYDWQRALIGKVLPVVSLIHGYEVLHAGAIDSEQGVVAIAAPSGSGKSTLATELLRRGYRLFADDALTLQSSDGMVSAHPGTPHMNLDAGLPDPGELGQTLAMLSGERWLATHDTVTTERPVRMICLLERAPGLALESRALPPNPLPLAPYMLGLAMDEQRERSRFSLYADLMQTAALVRLTAGAEHTPGQLADLLEHTLAGSPALAGALA